MPASEVIEQSPTATVQLRVGDARYRVAGSVGCEVAMAPPRASLPGAPHWLAGAVVYKGEVLPLVALSRLLDDVRAPDKLEHARIFVTRDAGFAVAYLVDDVDADSGNPEVRDLDLEQLGRDLLARAACMAATP